MLADAQRYYYLACNFASPASHPVVVAQKTATKPLLSDGRLALYPGAGEDLNEHVKGW
jgi:alkanesulfonate monooxygenase SsuD/methylene tetrahydromethanopterin reductase-like flavin-dependent oxidoreductase (luciferase family)